MSLAPETSSDVGFSEATAATGGTDTEAELNEPEVDAASNELEDTPSELKLRESEEELPKEKDPPPSPKSRPPKAPTTSSAKKLMKPSRPFVGARLQPNMRITHSEPLREREFLSGSESDSASETGNFLPKGAFLLTPSHDLSLEKASLICEKMNFTAPFSLTKTATGILFKFARPEDFQATYKKGFHKVTGARFYKKVRFYVRMHPATTQSLPNLYKIPIPCRPQKTFVVFVLEVPEEVPEEDIRHSLYKFHSVVEVRRLEGTGGSAQIVAASKGSTTSLVSSGVPGTSQGTAGPPSLPDFPCSGVGAPPLVRVTLASLDEYNTLLQNGLDFYGATFFPTEAGTPGTVGRGIVPGNSSGSRRTSGSRILDVVTASGQRVRDLLPVFDSAGFSRIPPPAIKTVKPSKRSS